MARFLSTDTSDETINRTVLRNCVFAIINQKKSGETSTSPHPFVANFSRTFRESIFSDESPSHQSIEK